MEFLHTQLGRFMEGKVVGTGSVSPGPQRLLIFFPLFPWSWVQVRMSLLGGGYRSECMEMGPTHEPFALLAGPRRQEVGGFVAPTAHLHVCSPFDRRDGEAPYAEVEAVARSLRFLEGARLVIPSLQQQQNHHHKQSAARGINQGQR